jgi:biopolymer transport protein ExbB
MIPIALCSVVAMAYAAERWLRLRSGALGTNGFGGELLMAGKEGGPERGLALCRERALPLARVIQPALAGWAAPFLEREKAVEDAGAREVRRLSANLRPLVVVAMIAPLLGLLGTVWGMIDAFSNIALADGLGKPENLAAGISQALVTTAAGLAVAIPTQAAYYWFRSRSDAFTHSTEDLYGRVLDLLQPAQAGGPAA